MKLQCKIGSVACKGQRWLKGECFEIDDEMGQHMVKHGLAVQVEDEEPGKPFEEEGPDSAALTDLSTMNVTAVTGLIETTNKKEILESFLEAEQAGKNRKTVIEALETKLAAKP